MRQPNHHTAKIAAAKRASPQAKITQEDARAIRESVEPLRVMSERYGIHIGTASKIRRGLCRRDFYSPWTGLGDRA